MTAVRQHAHHREQAARADAVGEHLVRRALQALHVHRRDAEHDEAHVAHRRIGDELLHVGLHHGDERAVDDGDDRERGEQRREGQRRLREHRKREADQPIAAHLQHHAGQNDRPRRGGLHVGIGQPGVEREQRHLDGKRHREGQEEPVLQVVRHAQFVELQQIERVLPRGLLVQPGHADDRHQHQHAAGHGVEQELDRRVETLVVAPDADEEIHRDEDDVPEDVEQEQIERQEHADHRRFQQQHENRELLHALVNAFPRRQQGDGREERREHHQHQADAVEAQVVVDAKRRNPGVAFDELEGGRRR